MSFRCLTEETLILRLLTQVVATVMGDIVVHLPQKFFTHLQMAYLLGLIRMQAVLVLVSSEEKFNVT